MAETNAGSHKTTNEKIVSLEVIRLRISASTTYLLLRLRSSGDTCGIGEASMSGSDSSTADKAWRLFANVIQGAPSENVVDLGDRLRQEVGPHPSVVSATAVSGLDQALWDLKGKLVEQPVYQLLGGRRRARIPLYANINRGLGNDRSPHAFAARAQKAVNAGFSMVKCAPFDGVRPGMITAEGFNSRYHEGIDRVTAVRQAVGSDIELMVDCHGRFDLAEAKKTAETLESLTLRWLEEPLPSHADMHVLARVLTGVNRQPTKIEDIILQVHETAAVASDTSIPIAGGEFFFGVDQFEAVLTSSGITYVMPDVKHCGGIWEMMRISELASRMGISVSPHNPTGPVATLASGHVCAALKHVDSLEYQWGEMPERDELVSPKETVTDGQLLLDDAPGFGIELNESAINEYRASTN